MKKRYNIRVYGIIINESNELLVADEYRFNRSFTKFPGGGLHWGEGIKQCLEREIEEEMELSSSAKELFYVNDFFQASAFNDDDQLLSFYFIVADIDFNAIPVQNGYLLREEDGEHFRWIRLEDLSEDTFTFPIDKIVARKLVELKTK